MGGLLLSRQVVGGRSSDDPGLLVRESWVRIPPGPPARVRESPSLSQSESRGAPVSTREFPSQSPAVRTL